MKDIAIYGAGGFGREVACLIKRINEQQPTWNLIGFYDDNELLRNKPISHFGICHGGINELNNYPNELAVVIAIGNSIVVKNVVDRITNKHISFPNIIHPNFNISDKESFQIGYGNIIQGGCSVTCSVSIGNFNDFFNFLSLLGFISVISILIGLPFFLSSSESSDDIDELPLPRGQELLSAHLDSFILFKNFSKAFTSTPFRMISF